MIMSPYSASFTAASLVLEETNVILPLLLSENAAELVKRELAENNLLKINSQQSRSRVVSEMRRRFSVVPSDFWQEYLTLPESWQRLYLFYANLKCYKLMFDWQFNVVVPKFRSVYMSVSSLDLGMYINELAARDVVVGTWKTSTIKKATSVFMLMLKQAGFINEQTGELQPVELAPDAYRYFINKGEEWFLEACLLPPYKIKTIKSALQR